MAAVWSPVPAFLMFSFVATRKSFSEKLLYCGRDRTKGDFPFWRRPGNFRGTLTCPVAKAPVLPFLTETSGDINTIWEVKKQALFQTASYLADNIQLVRRSVEDAKRDSRQWAALSRDADRTTDAVECGISEDDEGPRPLHRSDNIASALRLIDVLRNAIVSGQVAVPQRVHVYVGVNPTIQSRLRHRLILTLHCLAANLVAKFCY